MSWSGSVFRRVTSADLLRRPSARRQTRCAVALLLFSGCRSEVTRVDPPETEQALSGPFSSIRPVPPSSTGSEDPIAELVATASAEAVQEPEIPHPCQEGVQRCILLTEFGSRGHVWMMDTRGREYEFSASDRTHDFVEHAANDAITQSDFEKVVSLAKLRPIDYTISVAQVAHALSLLQSSRTGAVQNVSDRGFCKDGAGRNLSGYVLDSDRQTFKRVFLRSESCFGIDEENTCRAAHELARWVDHVQRRGSRQH